MNFTSLSSSHKRPKAAPEMEHAAILAFKTLSSQFYSLASQHQGPNPSTTDANSPQQVHGFSSGSRFGIADILGIQGRAATSPIVSPKSTMSSSSSSSSNLGK